MIRSVFGSLLLAIAVSSSAVASTSDLAGVPTVAIEVRQDNHFKDMIGTLQVQYEGDLIVLVAFSRFSLHPEQSLVAPTVYKITKRTRTDKSKYYLEGANQYGFRISGTLDLTASLRPIVDFTLKDGLRVVNITEDGRKFKEERMPRLRLGGQD